jgi:hypothetical protein
MALFFTVSEWAQVREGRKYAQLTPRSAGYRPVVASNMSEAKITSGRRLILTHDEDGKITGRRVETVTDETGRPVPLTITSVDLVDVFATEHPLAGTRALTFDDAKACCVRTIADLRVSWQMRHAQTDTAHLVSFAYGDHRDRDVFLNWTGQVGGDYTRNPSRAIDSDAPVLAPQQLEQLTRDRRAAAQYQHAYELIQARDGLRKHMDELKRLGGNSPEVGDSWRRLEREFGILERKIAAAAGK